jgi:hypothetical protein
MGCTWGFEFNSPVGWHPTGEGPFFNAGCTVIYPFGFRSGRTEIRANSENTPLHPSGGEGCFHYLKSLLVLDLLFNKTP